MEKTKTFTKGNIIVEDIKVGDIQYEFEYGMGIKSEVVTLPGKKDLKSKTIET